MIKYTEQQKNYFFVLVQALLFLLYAIPTSGNVFIISHLVEVLLYYIVVLGVVIILLTIVQLNKNLSPFPSPMPNSPLLTNGLFKYVRHPIYTGIILIAFSFALLKVSIFKLIIAFLLTLLFYFKSKYEESLLAEKFENYSIYMKNTGRFFPKIIFK